MKENINQELSGVRKDVSLADYTTFKIGGLAKYFFEAKTKEDIVKAIKAAIKCNLPFFILSRGSNLLISDKGYQGLIIRIANQEFNNLQCGAGMDLSKLVNFAKENELTGMEWAAGIPGTIGGAICGNAGAFEYSIADVLAQAEVLDVKEEEIKVFQNKDCQFSYRSSIFKKNPQLVILSAGFKLKQGRKENIVQKMQEHLEHRAKTQPTGFPCAGSIFKNSTDFSAGQMIERCGLKGKKIGKVEVSQKHANFIINTGGGTAKEVVTLINLIKQEVKKKTGTTLEEEIQYLG
ncbi:UDP-N-acetylmuramate dehydrogenase [Candidatus Parcubacteria bacterium]|nr:UDP-N-acetylmuramate dehydrogenase [Candidatus Parcubacteria bacterium]